MGAAPVACTVIHSSYPAMIPAATPCTLFPYPLQEVTKFVFDGTETFMELPQAYFHYAAFASNGKHLLYDVQGGEMESGDCILIDTCVLRTELPRVEDLMRAAAPAAMPPSAAISGPT